MDFTSRSPGKGWDRARHVGGGEVFFRFLFGVWGAPGTH